METFIKIITHPLSIKSVIAIIEIIVIGFIFRIISNSFSKRIDAPEVRYRTRKMITYLGYLVTFVFLLVVFYERLRGVSIFFGLIAAGVAFSLQRVIASIAGWIAISTQHFYTIGDRIQIGDIKGDVIDINVLRTAIMEIGEWVEVDLYTGRIVWISNGTVFDTPVYNYSRSFPYLWDQIKIPVKHGSDINLAKKIMLDAVNSIVKDYIDDAKNSWKTIMRNFVVKEAKVEPIVTLEINDNWIEFVIRYIVSYDQRVITRDNLFTQIYEEIQKTKGKVVFASQTVQIVGLPPLNVNLEKS